MATIASLDVRGSADFSDLTRALTKGGSDVARFAQQTEAALAGIPGLDASQFFAGIKEGATEAAHELGLVGPAADQLVQSLMKLAPSMSGLAPEATAAARAAESLVAALAPVAEIPAAMAASIAGTARFAEGLRTLKAEEAAAATEAARLAAPVDSMNAAMAASAGGTARFAEGLRVVASQQAAAAVEVARLLQPVSAIPAAMSASASGTELFARGLRTMALQSAQAAADADRMGRAFSQAGADTQTLSAEVRAFLDLNSRFALAAREAADGLTLQARAARTAAEANALAQAAGAGVGGGAALGAVAEANALGSAQARVALNADRMAAGLAGAARQASVLAAAEAAAGTGAGKIAAGFAGAAEQRAELDGLTTSVARGTVAFEGHGRAVTRATTAIGALAATSVGAEGPVAKLAESVLLFSGGELAVAAVAAGVLALAASYRFVTTAQRDAAEAQEKLVQGLLNEADQGIPAVIRAQQGLTAALEAQRKAREGLSLGDVAQTAGTIGTLVTAPGQAFAAEFSRRAAQAEADGVKAQAQAERDLARARQETQATSVQDLTAALQLRVADTGEIGRARDAVTALQAEEAAVGLTLEERVKLHQQILSLQQGLNAAVNAEIAARQFQSQREQERVQALAQAPGLGTDTAASVRERAAEEARLLGIIHSSTASLTERNAAQQQFNQLLDASLTRAERGLALDQQAAQQALTRADQLREQAHGVGATLTVRLDAADAEDALARLRTRIVDDVATADRLRAGLDANSAAARRLGDTATGLRGLGDAIDHAIQAARPEGLEALIGAVGAVAQRLQALRGASTGAADDTQAIGVAAATAAGHYAALAEAIARAGGATTADTRLIAAQAQALQSAGDGTASFVAALGAALTGLQDAQRATAALGAAVSALPDRVVHLTLDGRPATESLQSFEAASHGRADVQVALKLNVQEAEAALAQFKGGPNARLTDEVTLTANVERAQAALAGFERETEARQVAVVVTADVSAAEAQVDALLRVIAERQRAQAEAALGNVPLPNTRGIADGLALAQANADGLGDTLVRQFEDARARADALDHSILGIVQSLADMGGAAGHAVGDMLSLVGALQDVAHANDSLKNATSDADRQAASLEKLGAVFSTVSAGIGVGLGLVAAGGKTQFQSEHDRRLEENTQAIAHNSVLLGRQGQELQSSAILASLEAIKQQGLETGPITGGPQLGQDLATSANQRLAPFGLDVQDLAELAAKNHVNILDANGGLDLTAFQQWVDALDSGKISLLGLGDAADALTGSMLNLPEGFKVERARFNAQVADVIQSVDAGGGAPGPRGTDFQADTGSMDTGGASFDQSPVTTGPSFTGNTFVFNITGTGKSGEQVGREALAFLQSQAMATTGRTIDWPGVN